MITAEEAEKIVADVTATLRAAHEQLRTAIGHDVAARRRQRSPSPPVTTGDAVVTAVAADRLRALNEQLLAVPDGFTINAKLAKQLLRRRETIDREGSTGVRPRPSRTPLCSRTGSRSASRVRTPSGERSPTAT